MMIDGMSTSPEWQAYPGSTVVLGVGSFEQHSHHLPLDTDTMGADFFSRMVAEDLDCPVLPPIRYATCLEHGGFRGAISLRPETAMLVIRDIVDELERQHFTRLVVVSSHGGNFYLNPVIRDINRMNRSIKVLLVGWWEFVDRNLLTTAQDGLMDSHAGEMETSAIMAIAPEAVGERMVDCPAPKPDEIPLALGDLTTFGIGNHAPEGAYGYPTRASRETGEKLIESVRAGMLPHIRDRLARLDRNPRYSGCGALLIRPMLASDIGDGMRLKAIAGWNQLEADWQLYLDAAPQGCFCMVQNGAVAGTVTAVNYGNQSSWIGMVLVDPAYRRMGIATQLMNRAIESLADCACIKLDATPDGKTVYDRLGFVDEYTISRMVCSSLPQVETEKTEVCEISDEDWEAIVAFDTPLFGVERRSVLQSLWKMAPDLAKVLKRDGEIVAACLGRPGANLTQIGPVVARSEEDGKAVIAAAMAGLQGRPVVMDVPDAQAGIHAWIRGLGFVKQRPFIRMVKGENTAAGRPESIFAISGPELG
ncbi:MAG: GNAT family N-acetyltransferase [Planctomycetota bacterium]|jgi:creatinine amidohydrolase/Fe(II)-dependent formamide hydrolase-like protein